MGNGINSIITEGRRDKRFCFPDGSDGKESACNVGDLGLIPGLGRSPGEEYWLPPPVFWPGEFHGLCSPQGHIELDTTEQLSFSLFTAVF